MLQVSDKGVDFIIDTQNCKVALISSFDYVINLFQLGKISEINTTIITHNDKLIIWKWWCTDGYSEVSNKFIDVITIPILMSLYKDKVFSIMVNDTRAVFFIVSQQQEIYHIIVEEDWIEKYTDIKLLSDAEYTQIRVALLMIND